MDFDPRTMTAGQVAKLFAGFPPSLPVTMLTTFSEGAPVLAVEVARYVPTAPGMGEVYLAEEKAPPDAVDVVLLVPVLD